MGANYSQSRPVHERIAAVSEPKNTISDEGRGSRCYPDFKELLSALQHRVKYPIS